ncbi:MAG: MBL fold metallo-hydrolase [Desulfobacteraceae bacterium]
MLTSDYSRVNLADGRMQILLSGVPGVSSRGWLGYCTVVLFRLDGAWALFDTGHYSDRHLLLEALAQTGVEPNEIRWVVLSHLHFDHVLNLPLFRKAEVYLARAEMEHAEKVSAGEVTDLAIPDFWQVLLEGHQLHMVDERLDLTDMLQLVRLPGHTPGCLTMFWNGSEVIAVCGDVIKNAWEAETGQAEIALAGDSLATESINRVQEKATVIIPGHDRPFRRREEGLEFLTPFSWRIQASLYPKEAGQTVLGLDFPAGLSKAGRNGQGH